MSILHLFPCLLAVLVITAHDFTLQEECILIATDTLKIYTRPDTLAALWSFIEPGDSVIVTGRTEDSWPGFDPGVAQAGNIGSFRLRWIFPEGNYRIEGDEESVPMVWGPEAGVTYAMILADSELFSSPDSNHSPVDTVSAGSIAEIIQRAGNEWYELDFSTGSLALDLVGWMQTMTVSINGNINSVRRLE
jgi:hypothetical protein